MSSFGQLMLPFARFGLALIRVMMFVGIKLGYQGFRASKVHWVALSALPTFESHYIQLPFN
jgi:hypothetical protein